MRYRGRHDRAGRFIAAVSRGQFDVVQELFELRFATEKVHMVEELLFSYPLFAGSMYDDSEDPATGRVRPRSDWKDLNRTHVRPSIGQRQMSWKPRSPHPGETALDVAYRNEHRAILAFLVAWHAECSIIVQRAVLLLLLCDETFNAHVRRMRRAIYWPNMKLLLLAGRNGNEHCGPLAQLGQLELQRISQFLLGGTFDTEDLSPLVLQDSFWLRHRLQRQVREQRQLVRMLASPEAEDF